MAGRRHRLATRRRDVGLSQEGLAETLGVDRSTVVRWERGDTDPQPLHRPNLASALRISVEELAGILTDSSNHPSTPAELGHQVSSGLPGSTPLSPLSQPSSIPLGGSDLEAMQSLRLADRQIGGGYLYAAVISYLQHNLALRMFGHAPDGGGRLVFAAGAGLTEMAGWMAHDVGRDGLAEQHFKRALVMAETGGDLQAQAHILGSLSHLANHVHLPVKAVMYAAEGQRRLESESANPALAARLLAMEARGHAALRDGIQCERQIRVAEQSLALAPAAEPSPWVSGFDEASLSAEAARCFGDLGQLATARQYAERVTRLRPPGRVRSRAFGQLMLASIAARQGKLDEACQIGHEVLGGTRSLGSYLVTRQLAELGASLKSHAASRVTADFLEHLDAELRTRHHPAHWLPATAPTQQAPETA